ncbi:MAG: EscU/YscU/HrcU family type III secretion system export apparatus switch protein, partial [Myxococcota bacterium]
MSQEKTEQATPKQRTRFAEDGEVASSKDLTAVAGLTAAVLTLLAAWNAFTQSMIGVTRRSLGSLHVREIQSLVADGFGAYAFIVLSVGCAVVVTGAAVGLTQTGGRIFWKSLKLDPSRLNPLPKLKNMFGSLEALINLGLNVVKVLLMAGVCGSILYGTIPGLVRTIGTSTGGALMIRVLLPIVAAGLFTFLVIAILDYVVAYFKLEKKMRMSLQEVKDDRKETDGDPKIKQRQRKKALEFV